MITYCRVKKWVRSVVSAGRANGIRGAAGWTLLLGLLIGTGCYTLKIERAFEGEFQSFENNRVINEYCISCHLHRDFSSTTHVEEVSLNYNRKVFRYATECRVCHYLEKHWYLNDFLRKTRRPENANEGEYKLFEREFLESQKEILPDAEGPAS
ncbi:protein of unknown function [Nitrospina watsonii]|uniref:Uncharacterized protein n=1 Tax=Nitrospina watsonii TaxID=1323948 RepID=A0ABM9HBX3_9BACT|nr:protein of unknown function [Nitrospina watsonii]